MISFPIGRKYSCEEEWWHSTTLSQKQKEQLRSYVLGKLSKESCPIKETWIEQVNEQGKIFIDLFLHPQCEFIRIVKKDEEPNKEKRKQ